MYSIRRKAAILAAIIIGALGFKALGLNFFIIIIAPLIFIWYLNYDEVSYELKQKNAN